MLTMAGNPFTVILARKGKECGECDAAGGQSCVVEAQQLADVLHTPKPIPGLADPFSEEGETRVSTTSGVLRGVVCVARERLVCCCLTKSSLSRSLSSAALPRSLSA